MRRRSSQATPPRHTHALPAVVTRRRPHASVIAALAALVLTGAGIGLDTTSTAEPEAGPTGVVLSRVVTPVALTSPAALAPDAATSVAFVPALPSQALAPVAVGPSSAVSFTLATAPPGASAALLNVTATRASRRTSISLCAGNVVTTACAARTSFTTRPDGSGSTLVVAPLGGDQGDTTTLFNASGDVTVSADVSGYLVDGAVTATGSATLLVPQAATDVVHELTVRAGGRSVVSLPDVPAGATAVLVGLTASAATGTTALSVCPVGRDEKGCSQTVAMNAGPGPDRHNLVMVPIGHPTGSSASAQVAIRSTTVDAALSLDVAGYFTATAAPGTGGRLLTSADTDLLAWTGISAQHDVTVPLPDVPDGALAVAVRITGAPSAADAAIDVCPGNGSTCTAAPVLSVDVGRSATSTVLVPLDPQDRTHVTLHASGAPARVHVELQGFVVADPPAAVPPADEVVAASPGADATVAPGSTSAAAPRSTTPATPTAPAAAAAARPGGKPGPANTGVPAGTSLTVHEGDLVVTTPNTVIDSIEVRGRVLVEAANVTIRRSVILGKPVTSSTALVMSTTPGASVVIEDTEMYAASPSPYYYGILGSSFTLRRVNVHGVIDQAHITGSNVRIESSWLHDNLHYDSDPMQNGKPSHDDNIQIQQGTNIRVLSNTLEGSHNAGMMITQDQAKVSDVQYLNNWADGGTCTINIAEKGRGPVVGVVINDNRFGTRTGISDCAILSPPTTSLTAHRNVWDSTGLPVAVRQGA